MYIISTVIPIRNNLKQLRDCLDAISRQVRPPNFEVVIIDDGSEYPVPPDLHDDYLFPLRVVRQVPLGVSSARNAGIMHATGEIILFIDCDVVIEPDFMEKLTAAADKHPEDAAFQPALCGGKGNLVERMEGLRLTATINALATGDGHLKYANTSAFAVRRALVDPSRDFFNPSVVRGEDTLVLAGMLRRGVMPRLVIAARAVHLPRMPLIRYILKHFVIGYCAFPARDELNSVNREVLLDGDGRTTVFQQIRVGASHDPADRICIPLIVASYALERLGRIAYRLFGIRNERNEVLTLPLDGVRETELVARMVTSAVREQGMLITYLTAWTLVQASRDPPMSGLFRQFDVCYADGMGAVLCSFLLNGRRLHKVTANIFIYGFCEQVARQRLSVMLVGADEKVIETAAEQLKANYPTMELVGYSNGYFAVADEARLQKKLSQLKPKIVIVGMGQPLQENWCCRMRETFPDTVFLCVGGLFDYLAGVKPTPPRLIRKLGFEWLYILALRPRRFWKRYVFGIPMLGWLVIREYVVKVMALAQIGTRAKTQKK